MKTLETLKKIFCFALLGAFTISCNAPADKEAEKKEVVAEDKIDDANGEEQEANGE